MEELRVHGDESLAPSESASQEYPRMAPSRNPDSPSRAAREAWDRNAAFWDQGMGEGNAFFEVLVWPPTERLLEIGSGDAVLDVACGNGVSSRRLARLGARVVAVDFAAEMIACARRRARADERIDYQVLDATDEAALLELGRGAFQAVVCNMALFDMAAVAPLFRAVPRLLADRGRFVFSILHPCFNNPSVVQMGELEDRAGELATVYAVKISRYLSSFTQPGLAMPGQPVAHPYFHRSLTELLGAALRTGMVLDAFEERAFPPAHESRSHPLAWSGKYSEIPPVLVARLRPAVASGPEETAAHNGGEP